MVTAQHAPFPFPLLVPHVSLKVIGAYLETLVNAYPEYKSHSQHEEVTPEAVRTLKKVMQSVRPNHGHRATLAHTLAEAEMSGDHNPIHVNPRRASPRFGKKLIAHGMKSVTQATAALMHHLEASDLIPESLDIRFRDAVILGTDTILYPDVSIGESPQERRVEVFAENRTGKRLITRMSATVREGKFEEGELEYYLLSGWHISAALARLHPGCLYSGQRLEFRKSTRPRKTYIRVRGVGRDGNRVRIATSAHADTFAPPHAEGEAVIVLG